MANHLPFYVALIADVLSASSTRLSGRSAMCTISAYGTTNVNVYFADFRVAKSTHIPYGQLPHFSRNVDAFCEVIFHPIDPQATPLLRGHYRIIASRGL